MFADGSDGTRYLDVQGAKIVSEGAYFWFNLTSKNTHPIYDLQVQVWNHSRFIWLDHEEYFWLKTNESRVFHLIAPYINGACEQFVITIYCAVGGIATDKAIETVPFQVFVVDEPTTKSLLDQYRGKTFDELWTKYATASNENSLLKQRIAEAEDLNAMLKENIAELEKRVGNIFLVAFFLGAFSVVLVGILGFLVWLFVRVGKKEP